MNETEKIPFHEKRRQHFLTEERFNKFNDYFVEAIPEYNKWKLSDDLALRFLSRQQAETYWDYLKIIYTAGKPIEDLIPILEKFLASEEEITKFWQQNKAELNDIGYYASPMPWCDAEHYLKTLHLIALCYLLQREDLLPRLPEVILANAEDDLEPDTTIEDFLGYHFKNRPDPDYVQMGKHAILFGEAMRGETKKEQLEELNAYLKDWYRKMVGMNDLEYQSHLEPDQNGYCGYWAFEAAAIVYLDDLDDTELRKSPYYPKDMVGWAREQKRKREGKGKVD
nr:PoNe immunity protein domain-containing protein [uncultured Neisseria sp.]